jgi:MFS family permease
MTEAEQVSYYGEPNNIKRNIIIFFFDGATFMPSLALLSITTVFPFFLERLQASTFEFAVATSVASVFMLIGQPVFGSIVSRTKSMTKTFAKILFAQRLIFLLFPLSMPFLASNYSLMIWMFILFWAIFNFFSGSWVVFFIPILFKLLPPNKRAGLRGVGQALGNIIALVMAGLIPIIINQIIFPYNFMVIFILGSAFLLLNATCFWLMKEHKDVELRVPMKLKEYLKEIPLCLKSDVAFRAMIISCIFMALANAFIPFYTLYGIRVFNIDAYQIGILTILGIVSAIAVNLVFGFIIDRFGTVKLSPLIGVFIMLAGIIALAARNVIFFYLAWVFANIGNWCYMKVANLMLGDISPPGRSHIYVGVLFITTMTISSLGVLGIAPLMEATGFSILFVIITFCGCLGLFYNLFVFQKRLKRGR